MSHISASHFWPFLLHLPKLCSPMFWLSDWCYHLSNFLFVPDTQFFTNTYLFSSKLCLNLCLPFCLSNYPLGLNPDHLVWVLPWLHLPEPECSGVPSMVSGGPSHSMTPKPSKVENCKFNFSVKFLNWTSCQPYQSLNLLFKPFSRGTGLLLLPAQRAVVFWAMPADWTSVSHLAQRQLAGGLASNAWHGLV